MERVACETQIREKESGRLSSDDSSFSGSLVNVLRAYNKLSFKIMTDDMIGFKKAPAKQDME